MAGRHVLLIQEVGYALVRGPALPMELDEPDRLVRRSRWLAEAHTLSLLDREGFTRSLAMLRIWTQL
jgi:hypothetical protein